jgi:dynein heavy chain
LDTILSVQPKESAGGKPGETREAIVYKIAEDMLRKLPRDYVPHEIKEALIRLGGLLPMNIFLRQEIDRMQKFFQLVSKVYRNSVSLLSLKKGSVLKHLGLI